VDLVRLRIMRAVRGISQRELASAAGITEVHASAIATGVLSPTPELTERIHRVLGWDDAADRALDVLIGSKTGGQAAL